MSERRRTPLWQAHRDAGARLIDFGGWDLPVAYPAGTIKEHAAVRTGVGLFDVSHMGEARLRGPGARATVDRLTSNAVAAAAPGKAVYTLLCRPDGGIVDDCIFYKLSDEEFFVIVNAANTAKDLVWMREHLGADTTLDDESDATALIAVQGPTAVALTAGLAGDAGPRLAALPSFTFTDAEVAGVRCVVARTGYTGEDGFELACANDDAPRLWAALVAAGGQPVGPAPATLRSSRGAPAAVRQRPRRHHLAARGRPRLGGEARRPRLPRRRRPAPATGRGPHLSHGRAASPTTSAPSPATATPSSTATPLSAP
ncbi:MAG: hypothetical protein R2939_13925 [Kofleriaceae bacterium]